MNLNCRPYCIRSVQLLPYDNDLCDGRVETNYMNVPNHPTTFTLHNELDTRISLHYVDGERDEKLYGVMESNTQMTQSTHIGHVWAVYDAMSHKMMHKFAAGLIVAHSCDCMRAKQNKYIFDSYENEFRNFTLYLDSEWYSNVTKWDGRSERSLGTMKPRTYMQLSLADGEVVTVTRKFDGVQLLSYVVEDILFETKDSHEYVEIHQALNLIYTEAKNDAFNLRNYYNALTAYVPSSNFSH